MRRATTSWMVCGVLWLAGCAYESANLGGLLCDEGSAPEAGRRCVDGVWVAIDQGGLDMPDPLDMLDQAQDMPLADMVDVACVPRTAEQVCMAMGLDCGEVRASNNCGAMQLYVCGSCMAPDTCGGGGEDNKCGCPCKINGQCYAMGERNPANDCEQCLPQTSRTAWTAVDKGESCDDGQFCSVGEVCDGQGRCGGGAERDCSAAATGACHVGICNDRSGMCAITYKPLGTACALEGQQPTCVTGRCDAQGQCGAQIDMNSCLIDGVCYAAGETNPMNPCERCVPTTPTAWSPKSEGASCGEPTPCGPRLCNAQGVCAIERRTGCIIGGICYADGAPGQGANNTCLFCDEDANPTGWSFRAGTCRIGGRCWMNGEVRPGNSCQRCDAALTQTQWSNVSNGTACMGGTCNGGMCMR